MPTNRHNADRYLPDERRLSPRRVETVMLAPVDARRFGRAIRALRRHHGLRQSDVANRARISDSTVSRIELGRVGRITFATLRAVGDAVEADLELLLRWQAEGLDRLLDEDHSSLVAAVIELLQGLGWETAVEATFAIAGERGSVDVLAWHPRTGSIVVIEVKRVVPDNQAMLVSLDRKVRLACKLAAERGWTCSRVARFLVIADGRTTRRRIARHAALFDVVFPVRTRAALGWLRNPVDPAPSALLLLPKTVDHAGRPDSRRARARMR